MKTKETTFTKKKLDTIIKEYGPVNGPIGHERVSELLKKGEHMRILCIMESGTNSTTLYGASGHHFVNVLERYETFKPMPENLHIYDIYFVDEGESGLRHP